MIRTLRTIARAGRRHSALVITLLALATLSVDFVTGRNVQFPLLYVLPVALAAWMSERALAYAMSILLPLVRVAFVNPWHMRESIPVAGVNATIEAIALALYVCLLGRKASQATQLANTISTKEGQMQRLRAFTRTTSTTLQGRSVSPGMADGVVLVYLPPEHELPRGHRTIKRDEVQAEVARFERALDTSIRELDSIRERFFHQSGDEEVALVDVHLAILRDPSFAGKCARRVREGVMTAERAVAAETRDMETLLQGLKQECMRERSADVRDIGRRLLANLEGSGTTIPDPLPSLRPGTVLVAAELLLSDALRMNPANVAALVTEFTGPASHVAILARARHIPAVCDIEGATSLLASGDHVLVDAEAGTVTVAPTTMQKAHFASRRAQSIPTEPVAAREPAERCATKDGIEIGLHANISRPDEARIVLEQRLDGVGLFRSEFLFLDVDHPPDLDVQSAAYSEVARMLSPRSVVIRTMDLGGEKIPRFSRPDHDVALRTGKRGLMYSLAEKVMFRTQIQAIHRAAQGGNVRIMFPMVMGVSDLMEARQVVEDAFRTEQPAARPSIGAMIETPAAVFDIHGIMRIVDFVSVGTNDLAHFILAMDRGSRGSPGVLSFLHPSVLGAMQQIIRAAADEAVPLSVCGEAAGDPAVACLLVGMGVRHLSMNPFLAARVRHALRQITLEGAQVVAGEALTASTARDVQEIVGAAIREATS